MIVPWSQRARVGVLGGDAAEVVGESAHPALRASISWAMAEGMATAVSGQPVLQGVAADGALALGAVGPVDFEGVLPIRLGLPLGRHDGPPPRSSESRSPGVTPPQ